LSLTTSAHDSDDTALSQEQIRGVLQYLPTSEEKTALQTYLRNEGDSNVDGLCECEKFMVAIMAVKHAKQKLNAILYIQKFTSSLEELRRGEWHLMEIPY
jgi:restriction endonuclease Mrr